MYVANASTRFRVVVLGLVLAAVALGGGACLGQPDESGESAYSLAKRAEGHRRVADVYWKHTEWPRSNDKPPFGAVVSQEELRARAVDSLVASVLLKARWSESLTSETLCRETRRVLASTRRPAMLQELLEALGGDMAEFTEVLVRPRLARARLQARFYTDSSIHDAAWRAARNGVDRAVDFEGLARVADSVERSVIARSASCREECNGGDVIRLDEGEWKDLVNALRVEFDVRGTQNGPGGADIGWRFGSLGRIEEDDRSVYVRSVLRADGDTIELGEARWAKAPFGPW